MLDKLLFYCLIIYGSGEGSSPTVGTAFIV